MSQSVRGEWKRSGVVAQRPAADLGINFIPTQLVISTAAPALSARPGGLGAIVVAREEGHGRKIMACKDDDEFLKPAQWVTYVYRTSRQLCTGTSLIYNPPGRLPVHKPSNAINIKGIYKSFTNSVVE